MLLALAWTLPNVMLSSVFQQSIESAVERISTNQLQIIQRIEAFEPWSLARFYKEYLFALLHHAEPPRAYGASAVPAEDNRCLAYLESFDIRDVIFDALKGYERVRPPGCSPDALSQIQRRQYEQYLGSQQTPQSPRSIATAPRQGRNVAFLPLLALCGVGWDLLTAGPSAARLLGIGQLFLGLSVAFWVIPWRNGPTRTKVLLALPLLTILFASLFAFGVRASMILGVTLVAKLAPTSVAFSVFTPALVGGFTIIGLAASFLANALQNLLGNPR